MLPITVTVTVPADAALPTPPRSPDFALLLSRSSQQRLSTCNSDTTSALPSIDTPSVAISEIDRRLFAVQIRLGYEHDVDGQLENGAGFESESVVRGEEKVECLDGVLFAQTRRGKQAKTLQVSEHLRIQRGGGA